MDTDSSPPISAELPADLFVTAEAKLEQACQATATHAFNLAISFGLFPLVILMLVVFLVVRGSLPALLITGILSALALIIFASLVVNTSRERALQRTYREQVLPEMLDSARQQGIAVSDLPDLARQSLPEGALLLRFLSAAEGEPPVQVGASSADSPPQDRPSP